MLSRLCRNAAGGGLADLLAAEDAREIAIEGHEEGMHLADVLRGGAGTVLHHD